MFKNFFLATVSSVSPFVAAIESPGLMPIVSAVILPVIFFCIGKTVDVCMQIHFRRQEAKRRNSVVRSEKVNAESDARTTDKTR